MLRAALLGLCAGCLTLAGCAGPGTRAAEGGKPPTAMHAGMSMAGHQGMVMPAPTTQDPSECCDVSQPAAHHVPELSARQVAERYRLVLETVPARPVAGQEARVTVRVTDPRGAPVTTFQVHHERLAHFIVVSENLEEFHHLHPEEFGLLTDEAKADGRFTFPVTFGSGGVYAVAMDFVDQGSAAHAEFRVAVEGPAQGRTRWNLAARREGGGLTARLHTMPLEPEERSRVEANVELTVGGAPVTDLDPYLGALLHVAVFREGATDSAHVHGGGEEFAHMHHTRAVAGYRGPKLYFGHRFDQPGRYRLFAQFQRAGRVHLVPFDLEVRPRSLGGA